MTLAPEGGAHQSINTPLIGMAQDGLLTFEPAFVDELSVIMAHAFDYVQRDGKEGGSVYLRLSTRSLAQPQRVMTPALERGIIEGAYWLREPGPNAELVVAVTGAPTPEAIEAVGLMAEDRRDIGLLAVTSYDRLNAGWSAAQRAREAGDREAFSHIEDFSKGFRRIAESSRWSMGHPATLGWLGAVMATGPGRSASNASGKPAPSPTCIVTTGSIPKGSSRPPEGSLRKGRSVPEATDTASASRAPCTRKVTHLPGFTINKCKPGMA